MKRVFENHQHREPQGWIKALRKSEKLEKRTKETKESPAR